MRKSVVDQAKGHESYIGVWRLSETNTNKFQETRLSKSKPRSKFV